MNLPIRVLSIIHSYFVAEWTQVRRVVGIIVGSSVGSEGTMKSLYRKCSGVFILVLVFATLHAGLAVASPWGWHGDGVVKVTGGRPAICIPDDAEKDFSVESVWLIQEHSGLTTRLAWDLRALPGAKRFVMKPGQCLSYGASLAGYTQVVPPRPLIEAGRYTFRLNGDAVKRTDAVAYWGSFCLKASGGVC
ncbi:hypothetical protein D3C71_1195370 [compost metagenome]